MAVRNDRLGGTDVVDEEIIFAADTNDTFNAVIDYSSNLTPIGTINSWLKSYPNTPTLPDMWVECNGQVLNDPDSPYNGQTIPNLNNENRFLRGSLTSGGTGGAPTHTLTIAQMPAHSHTANPASSDAGLGQFVSGSGSAAQISTNSEGGGQAHNNEPQYYNVVWIMRIK